MTATFNWQVTQMSCYPQAEGQTDVVFTVYWSCSALQPGDNYNYSAATCGAVMVSYQQGDPYTPYDQLTEQQVLGWVWAKEPQATTEALLQANIDLQINPPVVSPPLPWATPAA